MDKQNQVPQSTGSIPKENILALSWNIATEPKLYWELAPNPYSHAALKIISERFPDAKTIDVIRAVIIAEPEGKYDRNFGLLETAQQSEDLQRQKDISNELQKQLAQYGKKNEKEFSRLPKNIVFDSLSLFVFETADVKEIEQKYAQEQRREIRLAIVDFIEDHADVHTNVTEKKLLSRQSLLAAIFVTSLFLVLLYSIHGQIQKRTQQIESSRQILGIEAQKENQKSPQYLKIPRINVDASVKPMGLTPDGAMDVPGNTNDVGWYKLGPKPGEKGNAVISGHFDNRIGESGVFNHLGKLKQGDKIYVTNNIGETNTFVVRESRTYMPGYAEEVFLPRDNGTYLNLITCDGTWDIVKKSYSKRLVVFADILL